MEHLIIIPNDKEADDQGHFFETFIAGLLQPMRLKVIQRLRFTGMEIDLLARGEDQPRTILVECKAQRDPLPSEVISKLIGNVELRHADSGWLFSVADLTKDGRGQWEEIQKDPALSNKFMWYASDRIIDILKQQRTIVDSTSLVHHFGTALCLGTWTLLISPKGWYWLVEITEGGIPTHFSAFDAITGQPIPKTQAQEIAKMEPRFDSLEIIEPSSTPVAQLSKVRERAPVARVIAGDTWDDLRPARPADFVGRDEIITAVLEFFTNVRDGLTDTRTFAIQGPSGWGKSSLVLKILHEAMRNRLQRCSVTAVDTRSATNSAFVSEALRLAFLDAIKRKIIPKRVMPTVDSLRMPLDSKGLKDAFNALSRNNACVVLIFDQFEELFAKEDLFETFNAVRELSLDCDAQQVPIALGFAWKTDVALPQQHPAYHLWHQLSDRRRTFKIREFGRHDIRIIIARAERASGKRLSPALRARIVEQSQNLPWLIKKLLVHVLQRISSEESQYLFLERELDVELLFKEDLSVLKEEQIRCLKHVAQRAPIAVAEVEENFSHETTNMLLNAHLLVRSGMNYVVYWDIFRDYLVDERVPYIPWARTFQRGAATAVKALQELGKRGPSSIPAIGEAIRLKEGPAFNLFGDLVALQLVESTGPGAYVPTPHLKDLDAMTIAEFVQGQLNRHIVVRELTKSWEKEKPVAVESWLDFFRRALPRASSFSQATIRQYANSFKSWLLFAGIIEQREHHLLRSSANSRQMGVITPMISRLPVFLGTSAPQKLAQLLGALYEQRSGIKRDELNARAFRNAITDAFSIDLIVPTAGGNIKLSIQTESLEELICIAKDRIAKQKTVSIVNAGLKKGIKDRRIIGEQIETEIGAKWSPTSRRRYAGGLLCYIEWLQDK
jgi:hypothetical protein